MPWHVLGTTSNSLPGGLPASSLFTSCLSFCVPLPTLLITSGCFYQGASMLKSLRRSPLCGIRHPVNSTLISQFLKISPIFQGSSSVHSSSDRSSSVPSPFWCRVHWVSSDRNPTYIFRHNGDVFQLTN